MVVIYVTTLCKNSATIHSEITWLEISSFIGGVLKSTCPKRVKYAFMAVEFYAIIQ